MDFASEILGYKDLLMNYAKKLKHQNIHDAEDLFQTTILKALTNKDKFKPGTNLRAWLTTIMTHQFINEIRLSKKRDQELIESPDLRYFSGAQVPPDALSNLNLQEMSKSLTSLENILSTAFILHFEGYKYKEISKKLNLSLGTVKSRIYYARERLKILCSRN